MSKLSNVAVSSTHHTSSQVPYSRSTMDIIHDTSILLRQKENLHLPLDETLKLLEQLSEFDLGRFLLHNRSLNGYWTAYVFRNNAHHDKHPLEEWLLNRSLLTLARERFHRFKRIIQQLVRDEMCLASIPSGVMDDLLDLDYTSLKNITLVGIDLDPESIALAKQNAIDKHLSHSSEFIQGDAWDLDIVEKYDIISSNGLNMYESEESRLLDLYRSFYRALKPNGYLVISFLQPPPDGTDPNYSWANYNITHDDLMRERAIFGDILSAKFLNFCSETTIKNQLNAVGFTVRDIIYNDKGTLPIAVVQK